MQQNSGNTYSLVYVYQTTSNNQMTLNTEMTLRKQKKKTEKKQDRPQVGLLSPQ
jgi:hypothetical protein